MYVYTYVRPKYHLVHNHTPKHTHHQVTLIITTLAACTTVLLYAAGSTHTEQVIIMHNMGVLLQRRSMLIASCITPINKQWHVDAFISHNRICGTTVVEQIGCGEVVTRAALVVDHGQHMYLLGQDTCRTIASAVAVYQAAACALQC